MSSSTSKPLNAYIVQSICRVPLYYSMKMIFLLYLALPQTQGSSYIYKRHVQPFFNSHESQIDAALASMKTRIYNFLQEKIRALWEHVVASVGQQVPPLEPAAANAAPAPSLSDPASGPAQLLSRMWQSYGPGILAASAALLRQSAAPAAEAQARAPAPRRQNTSQSVLERRRQLEAELASLPPVMGGDGEPFLISSALAGAGASSSSFEASSRSPKSSGSDLRERPAPGGRFEEIEGPDDLEGYDVDGDDGNQDDPMVGNWGDARASGGPGGPRRTSWFGWGGGTSGTGKGSYERVKNE